MLLFIKLGFFDILDILIVAFIFYQIYRLVKGTVAINIFAGIFTFYVAWLLVRALNMELITSIMGQFFGMGMIALLIVFQQEVRRFYCWWVVNIICRIFSIWRNCLPSL